MDYRWYVAQALPGLEATAIYHLSRAGITGFSPTVSREAGPARPGGSLDFRRLFPGYIFVELENVSEAGLVNRTRGIRKVLPHHLPSPLALPVGFIEDLQGRISRKELDESSAEDAVYRFVPQEEVIVKTGPFRDHCGRFLRYSKGAAVVVLALLGKEFELKRPAKEFLPAQKSNGPGSRSAFAPIAA